MKRFLVFAGDSFYPAGGWDDLQGDYETLKEARESLSVKRPYDWHHIVDTKTGEQVEDGGDGPRV
jgi:hypothetical protein